MFLELQTETFTRVSKIINQILQHCSIASDADDDGKGVKRINLDTESLPVQFLRPSNRFSFI